MAPPKKNKYAVKLTTDDLKKQAYKQYCEYLASGKSKEGWYFEHPTLSCTYKTIEKYMKEEPDVFPPLQKELAIAKAFEYWEDKGKSMMEGKSKSETALYQMFMRNKFGWDKKEEKEDVDTTKLQALADFFSRINPSLSKSQTEE